MNRVKVIKEIKGLKVGDILTYNETIGKYFINKTDRDIAENSTSTRSLFVSIDKWVVEDSNDYFTYIDDEGNEIDMQNISYSDIHPESKGLENIATKVPSSTQVVYWRIRNPFEKYLLWM